ncbi:hypothetical protein QOT17_012665 [Balamuthia mandrillaris]
MFETCLSAYPAFVEECMRTATLDRVTTRQLRSYWEDLVAQKEGKANEKEKGKDQPEKKLLKQLKGMLNVSPLVERFNALLNFVLVDMRSTEGTKLLKEAFQLDSAVHHRIFTRVQVLKDSLFIEAELQKRLSVVPAHPFYNQSSFQHLSSYNHWRRDEEEEVKHLSSALSTARSEREKHASAYKYMLGYWKKEKSGARGKLYVRVTELKNLEKSSGCYCFFSYDKKTSRSRTLDKTESPNWDEEFTFNVYDLDKDLKLELFSHDPFAVDTKLGSLVLSPELLYRIGDNGANTYSWHELGQTSKGALKIQLWVEYMPYPSTLAKQQKQKKHVFGPLSPRSKSSPSSSSVALQQQSQQQTNEPSRNYHKLYRLLLLRLLRQENKFSALATCPMLTTLAERSLKQSASEKLKEKEKQEPSTSEGSTSIDLEFGLRRLSKTSCYILKEYACRHGILEAYTYLVYLAALVTYVHTEHIVHISEVVAQLHICLYGQDRISLTLYERKLLCRFSDRLHTIACQYITHYKAAFPENEPKGCISALLDIISRVREYRSPSFEDSKDMEDIVAGLLKQYIKNTFQRLLLKHAPPSAQLIELEYYSPLQLVAVCDDIMKEVKEDILYYQDEFANSGINMTMLSAQLYTKALRKKLQIFFGSCCTNEAKQADIRPETEIFELYFKLKECASFFEEKAGVRMLEVVPLNVLMLPYMRVWLQRLEQKLSEWCIQACQLDNWEPLTETALYSSSLVDMFTAYMQGLEFLVKLKWEENDVIPHDSPIITSILQRTGKSPEFGVEEILVPFTMTVCKSVRLYTRQILESMEADLKNVHIREEEMEKELEEKGKLHYDHKNKIRHSYRPAPAHLNRSKEENEAEKEWWKAWKNDKLLFLWKFKKDCAKGGKSKAANFTFALSKRVCIRLNNLHSCKTHLLQFREALLEFYTQQLNTREEMRKVNKLSKQRTQVITQDIIETVVEALNEVSELITESLEEGLELIGKGVKYVIIQELHNLLTAHKTTKQKLKQLFTRGGALSPSNKQQPESQTHSPSVPDQLAPLFDYIDEEMGFLTDHLYYDLFANLLSRLWNELVEDLLQDMLLPAKHERSLSTSQALLLQECVSCLVFYFDAEGEGVARSLLDNDAFFLETLLNAYQRPSDEVISFYLHHLELEQTKQPTSLVSRPSQTRQLSAYLLRLLEQRKDNTATAFVKEQHHKKETKYV